MCSARNESKRSDSAGINSNSLDDDADNDDKADDEADAEIGAGAGAGVDESHACAWRFEFGFMVTSGV